MVFIIFNFKLSNTSIEEMYNGTLRPFGEADKSKELVNAVKEHLNAKNEFLEKYPKCKEDLEKLLADYSEIESGVVYESFIKGFKTGTQLLLEILNMID